MKWHLYRLSAPMFFLPGESCRFAKYFKITPKPYTVVLGFELSEDENKARVRYKASIRNIK